MSTEGGESSSRITISVHTTTGGRMQLQLQPQCTVAALKKTLSARLRLAKDRMVLLHRNRQLKEGTLDSNNVRDGERLTLLPSVETGLQAIKPEQSVMQALESLTDAQVENFLCGRAPLHLTMRLGDHVMFVQLQLCPPVETPPATPTSPNCPAPLPPWHLLPRRHPVAEQSLINCATWVRASTLAVSRAPWDLNCRTARVDLVATLPPSCTFSGTFLVPARAGVVLSPQRARRHGHPRLLPHLPVITGAR
ncbi:hypothetical protein MRX96_011947 [Rhipicephalus microplus]